MKKISLAILLCLFCANGAWGHGSIESLPNSVQVMQYKMLLYMNPDDLPSRNGMAMALYRSGDTDQAIKELEYILKKDPSNFDALDGMGVVLIKKENYTEALQYLEKALAINDKDVMIHVHFAVIYDKMNQPDKSKAELEKAGSLVTDSAQIEKIDKELKIVSGN